MDREVTFLEYIEFLNQPSSLSLIDSSEEPVLYPGDGTSRKESVLARGPDGRFVLAVEMEELPLFGVSYQDAEAYARWKTLQARAAEKPWSFALPSRDQWEKAARGADRRIYPYGDHFLVHGQKSRFSGPSVGREPVLSYPVDESPYGVFDLCGSLAEFCSTLFHPEKAFRTTCGGVWFHANPDNFQLGSAGGTMPRAASGILGFRLVAYPADS